MKNLDQNICGKKIKINGDYSILLMKNQEIIDIKKKYLKFAKLSKSNYFLKETNCDICNSKKKNLLSKKILWGKIYGRMPVVSCDECGYVFQKYKFDRNFNKDFYAKTYFLAP